MTILDYFKLDGKVAIVTGASSGLGDAPAFTDSDLTATKDFHIGETSAIQFRAAAFNFLNHANSSFTSSDKSGSETALNLSNTNNGATEQSATSNNAEFGIVPLREGRRIMELSLKYTF